VYRRFEGRDRLVHAVLAREARTFFAAIGSAVAHLPTLEDQVVEGMLVGIRTVRVSVLMRLLERDPGAVLPLLTSGAAPLIAVARHALVELHRAAGRTDPPDGEAELVADALVRLGLSLVVSPSDLLDLDDNAQARAALARWVGPLLRS
jgi:AcrR family transcriptional regulator